MDWLRRKDQHLADQAKCVQSSDGKLRYPQNFTKGKTTSYPRKLQNVNKITNIRSVTFLSNCVRATRNKKQSLC